MSGSKYSHWVDVADEMRRRSRLLYRDFDSALYSARRDFSLFVTLFTVNFALLIMDDCRTES